MNDERLAQIDAQIRDALAVYAPIHVGQIIGSSLDDLLAKLRHLQTELDTALAVMHDMKTESSAYQQGLYEGRKETITPERLLAQMTNKQPEDFKITQFTHNKHLYNNVYHVHIEASARR